MAKTNDSGEGKKVSTRKLNNLKKKAEFGDAKALNELASLYYSGEIDDENPVEKTIELLTKAAQADDEYLLCLATVYDNEQNYVKALEYYEKAANIFCYEDIRIKVGSMYEHGIGTEKDEAKALEWYIRASEKMTTVNEFTFYYQLHNIVHDEKNEEKGIEWYIKIAEQNPIAQLSLGKMYEDGILVAKNYDESFDWYQKAAKSFIKGTVQGDPKSMFNLAVMFFIGKGVRKDNDKAMELYRKAESLGCSDMMLEISIKTNKTMFVLKDILKI